MKIGPHVQRPTPEAIRWSEKAPVVKAVDYPEILDAAPAGAIKIFRAYFDCATQEWINPRDFLDLTLARLAGHQTHYIESRNEFRSKISEGLATRLEWDKEFVRLAHAAGYRVCGGNDATGTQEAAEIQLQALNGWCGWDALGRHEYWDNGLPFDGWLALRYRKEHEWAGSSHPPLLITECGGQNTTDANAVQRLVDYDAELQKDAYVLGAVAFTAGSWQDWIDLGYDWDARVGEILPLYLGNPTYTLPSFQPPKPEPEAINVDTSTDQLLAQNALIVQALIAFREGRLTGADGVDGYIAALRGGQVPAGYKPVGPAYPKG